jgi:2-haloalkanoic acid dehalogenase type II
MAGAKIRVATFDCYGTLVDWEGGVAAFLYDLALRHGEQRLEPGSALREQWEAIQFELIQGPYRPYREVLAESLRRWMNERGYRWGPAEGEALLRSVRGWQPFPDTCPALRQARAAGLRLVIISNTDRDIIEHTLRHLEFPFDEVITAQDCQAYKPSLEVFRQALARLGEQPERVLHVALTSARPSRSAARPPGSTVSSKRRRARNSPTTSGETCGAWPNWRADPARSWARRPPRYADRARLEPVQLRLRRRRK